MYSPWGATLPEEVAELCDESVILTMDEAKASSIRFGATPFQVIHVFRLYTVDFANPYLQQTPTPRVHLDLDDIETISRRRIAARYRHHGLTREAEAEEATARDADRSHQTVLPRFDRIYVCSRADVPALPPSLQARVRILPNVYQPTISLPAPLPPDQVELLFVGTLGYFPNAEGIGWFAQEVLPLLQTQSTRPVVLRIVGLGMSPLIASLRVLPNVEVVGFVEDLLP